MQPTANDVHVNGPLGNISIDEGQEHLTDEQLAELIRNLYGEALGKNQKAQAVDKAYPNEHAARQRDPGDFETIRSKEITPGIRQLYGIQDGKATVQSVRFDADKFTPDEAKKWLTDHGYQTGSFEPALNKGYRDGMSECSECGSDCPEEELEMFDGLCMGCADGVLKSDGNSWEAVAVITKADDEKRLLYGVVYAPGVYDGVAKREAVDTQNDVASADEIMHMAHNFILHSGFNDLQHREVLPKERARVVESYIAPIDFDMEFNGRVTHVAKGSWVAVTHVPDDAIWEMVKNGEIGGYSLKGSGKRRAIRVAEDA